MIADRPMATQADIRRIAMSLAGTTEAEDRFAFSVSDGRKEKGYAWVWMERVHPKKARVPQPKVLAVRVADELEKQMLLSSDEEKFFTEPHYDGFPAILVRIAAVSVREMRELLTAAWRIQSAKRPARAAARTTVRSASKKR